MADKIQKALQKLKPKERQIIYAIIKQLVAGNIDKLDIKQLKGNKDIYRVRKGDIRIIYFRDNQNIKLLQVARRNEKTYRNYN
jgi:mRNA-degrading endonuclease RelE of RelBE toxin-antitoxin system